MARRPINSVPHGSKLTGQIGYDVSNVANIQSRLYEEFGRMELLSWISLSYSLALFSVMYLVRDLTFSFNLRWLYLANLAVFVAGAAVAGSAQTMAAVILGRVIMGVGGAFVQQMRVHHNFNPVEANLTSYRRIVTCFTFLFVHQGTRRTRHRRAFQQ